MALLAIVTLGCAETSWEGTLTRNTVASYNKFLRDHPNSSMVPEAKERIEFLRVKALPRIDAFETFAREYPNSSLLPELRVYVEPLYFKQARSANTAEAYGAFLARYPDGKLTSTARGNLVYVESVRDRPNISQLERFVVKYPESDFSAEARRTLGLLEHRVATEVSKIAVRVDVAPNVAQRERVRRGFGAIVARHYGEQGVEVVLITAGEEPPADAQAWVRIEYREAPASGTLGGRTLVSHCRIRVYHRSRKKPIWDRTFEAPADHILHGAYGRDKTLFANSTYRFWREFFVPVATWASSEVRVHRQDFSEETAAIDVRGDHAVVMYRRGGFDYLDVSSPLKPQLLERYRRERDLTRWSGVRLLSDRLIVTYGPDGLELVELGDARARRIGRWELPEVGSVLGTSVWTHPQGRTLLLSSTRGVFAIRLDNRPLRANRLLEGEFVGVHVAPPYVYLVQAEEVEVTTPRHLLQHLTGRKLSLGKGFGARRTRASGTSLYVFGRDGAVEVSLATPGRPKVTVNLAQERVGRLGDVASDDGHLYLLGERGLAVAHPSGEAIVDFVQVAASESLSRKGRYLFLVGGQTLEVVDLTPYQVAVASPLRD